MKPALLKKLRSRDLWCWHCGQEEDLVPHHRKNRGMGGAKSNASLLNDPRNIILVCARYNGLMESSSSTAREAREKRHKIRSVYELDEPVYDASTGGYYVLTEKGTKEIATHKGNPLLR